MPYNATARIVQFAPSPPTRCNCYYTVFHGYLIGLSVIDIADWLIDMGPDGGDGGGLVVAEGTPEQVAAVDASYTGKYLRRVLGMP